MVIALPVNEKSTPLTKRTPVRSSVTLELIFFNSMYSNASGGLVFPSNGAGLYIISVMRRNCWAALGLPG